MNEELKIIIKAVTDSAKKAINEVSGELEGLSKGAKGASGKMGAAFKGMAKGAAIAVHSGTVLIMNGGSLSDNSMKIDRKSVV